MKKQKGFTLIELLLVVSIIAILAVIVLVALDPAKRLKDSKDARRRIDVDSILKAVHTYTIDNKGSLPTGLAAGMAERQLGTAASGAAIATGGCSVVNAAALDLSTPLDKYLKEIPVDSDGTAALTKYSIQVDANGLVTVKACGAENATIYSAG
jgi:prepilin-type N-terminal cleavage/methylation domain-containing protein